MQTSKNEALYSPRQPSLGGRLEGTGTIKSKVK